MSDFTAPDYEPTAQEIDTFIADTFAELPLPGQHGSMTIIPGLERYIWRFPVFWGYREVNTNGSISLSWCVPQPCPHEDES